MPEITVSRIRLGAKLAELRAEAGVSRSTAAAAAGCSLPHLSHLETGRNAPSTIDQLEKLAKLYKVPDASLGYLRALWVDASKLGWWSTFGLTPDYARYVGLETDAAEILVWEPQNIHGLLQTERYMRHGLSLEIPPLSPRTIDKRVLTRLHRQHRVVSGGDNPLRLVAVFTEEAVRRAASTPLVAAGQLQQLVSRASLPNVELRILLIDQGMHAGQDGAFSILSFPLGACPAAPTDPLLPPHVYQEHRAGAEWTTVPSAVDRMHTRFRALRDQALGPTESLAWLTQLIEKHNIR